MRKRKSSSRGGARKSVYGPLGLLAAFVITAVVALVAPASPMRAWSRSRSRVSRVRRSAARRSGRSASTRSSAARSPALVDPSDPKNAMIADIANAPRNAQGLVEYAADFLILRPVDLSKGNHRVVYDVTNRGAHRSRWRQLNSAPGDRTILDLPRTPATAS